MNETMTSRERIRASIRHEQPDRVPIDLGATNSSNISAIAYHNFKQYLGINEGHTWVYDVVQQLAQPEDMILDRFGIDVLDIGRAFDTNDEDWYDIVLRPQGITVQFPTKFHPTEQPDGTLDAFAPDGQRIGTKPIGADFFDQTHFPYLDGYPDDYRDISKAMAKTSWGAFVTTPWNHMGESDFWQQLRERTLALRESTDRALMAVVGCNLFEWGTYLRRIDNFLMDLASDQDNVERLLDALMEVHMKTLENVCNSVGDVVDIIRFSDDLATDTRPFMAPRTYRKLFKPRQKIMCDYVKEHSQAHTFLHSCGSIYKLLPDLIEAGFEVINPVQTNSCDMDPQRLKDEFGADITFWGGGVDTRHILNRASPAEVKDQVTERLGIFSPGGGYVFNTIHNILPDVPPENLAAMFEAVREFNKM
jgi:uroporphyrinogen decarboxylase